MHSSKILSVVAILLSLSGCGTNANIHGMKYPLMGLIDEVRPRAFGGTANDVEWIRDCYWPVKPFFVLDMPVSLVADVITLPKIRTKQIEWDTRRKEEEVKPPAPAPDAASDSN